MKEAIVFAIGVLAGGAGYHYLFSPIAAQLAAAHTKLDAVISAIKK